MFIHAGNLIQKSMSTAMATIALALHHQPDAFSMHGKVTKFRGKHPVFLEFGYTASFPVIVELSNDGVGMRGLE
jgi:hypothetical protein